MNARNIVELANASGDFVQGDDGVFVFWPVDGRGALTAQDLRALAEELDARNEGAEP